MIDMDLVQAHRDRALNPEKPVLRGTAQNPDVFFQAREACNKFLRRHTRHRSRDYGPFCQIDRTWRIICSTM